MHRCLLAFVLTATLVLGPSPGKGAQPVERVGVLPPGSEVVRPATAQLLGEFFGQEVAQDVRFELVERSSSPCGDPVCAASAGRRMGAERVLWCRVQREGDRFLLTVTATHVGTGSALGSASVAAGSEDELFVAVGSAVPGLLDALYSPPPAIGTPPGTATSPDESRLGLPSILHQPIERAPVGRELRVEARVEGDLGARELYVMFQVGGSDRVRYTRLRSEGRDGEVTVYASEIPSSALTSAGLRYHLRLTDARGDEISRVPASGWWSIEPSTDPNAPVVRADRPTSSKGSRDQAAQGTVPPSRREEPTPSTPVLGEGGGGRDGSGSKRWWWIGGAAAVAVGGLVAILGGGGATDPGEPIDPGPTTLPDPPEHR